MSLKIENLTGGYSQTPVIKDISFDINNGELVGLIGLNGAGKSTTIKHIIGLMDPFSGQMTLDGQALKENPSLYRKKIGFIPETPLLYDELTLKEHIEITAMAYDVDVSIAMERATPLLKKFRLQDRLEWFPSDFSKGMKQKVMILCAFITEPSLYIIDEPFLGLDPIAIRDLIQMMEQKKKEGASLLMSTHVLTNAEKICDKFIIINRGEIYAKGTLKDLRETFSMPNASLDDIYTRLADKEGFLK
ncbi:MAG: ABC transporter ATP-binding protein [Alkalibacterium gilvum]|uniref:ABC-2 type transport system ATP-binding protein n=1 Tax=Alkalibacterium gilvum TaxID=1130080 RepID=A0A1H6V525_9LACT|nr:MULTISPECIES: ABC transporter ATP-binding protein [Alkalibacterium]MDN6293244.1 ABC transporter ATP-binding protein [Alkalibacterium sp.]MDN6294980.1 ABC transporter ATP-binding protein [Alkalibacterium sp.]MDN6397500.1 ABC transporter ATP-binding protein [Alkalibacterium sp.]MDN6728695.1 ABC transporter ATP-binding protein [Alkalibacterium sp.]SEI99638.1 ABC-2 type transport system ATP-binding protein [Alkalibacterium gilvum]